MSVQTPVVEVPRDGTDGWWRRRRSVLFDVSVAVVAALALVGLVLVAAMPWAVGSLDVEVAGRFPFWVLLLVGIPVTAWTASRSLALSRFAGAVLIAFDSAVLAFLVWVGTGSVLAEACAGGTGCGADGGTHEVLGLGAWTVLAWLVGVTISELRRQRRRALVKIFNVSIGAIGGGGLLLTIAALRLGVDVDGQMLIAEGAVGPRDLLSIVLAALVYTGIDFILTATSVAWKEGVRIRMVVQDGNALVASAAAVSVLCSAVFAALLTLHNPWSLVLLTPVIWSLVYAARVGTVATSEHERSKALYSAASACQSAEVADDVLEAVVKAARRALHAPVDLVTTGPGPEQEAVRLPGEHDRWLLANPRTGGQAFDDRDREVLHTLAAMAGQSLARVESTERIRRVAETDHLTGVATRTVLLEQAERVLHDSAGGGGRCSLIFCDVDDFKAVNDTLGHRAGDAVLVEVADRLREAVRPSDVVARVGGDEFAVLLPGADAEAAAHVRGRLLSALAAPHDLAGTPRRVVVSTGCATWPSPLEHVMPGEATDWLLEEADREMYAVKHAEVVAR